MTYQRRGQVAGRVFAEHQYVRMGVGLGHLRMDGATDQPASTLVHHTESTGVKK
jgi:hypothetical protein